MRKAIRVAAVALCAFVVLPLFAADEKKTDDKKDVDKKAPDLVAGPTFAGKILQVNESKKTLKIRVSVINQGEADAIARDQIEIQKVLLTERNPVNRANRIAQLNNSIAQHTARLNTGHKDIDVTATEDVKVRMANPPVKFDEKGKVVHYTKDELKELKGDDPKATTYKAEFSDLRAEQAVQLVTMKKKGKPVLPKPEPGKKDVDPADVAAILAEFEPKVTTIVILAEPAAK
jgi:hypothetical protein